MNLYEINRQLVELVENSVDPETGEIVIDDEALEALTMQRDEKLENIGVYIKDLTAEAAAIKAEEQALKARRESKQKAAERLKMYVADALNGSPFETAKVAFKWRTSKAVEFSDEEAFMLWAENGHDDLLSYKAPTPNKTAIGKAIDGGAIIPGARRIERNNLSIK